MNPTDTVNIATHLPDMARRQPCRPAVVFPHGRDLRGRVAYTHLTFRQLDEASDRVARGLDRFGIGRGARTVLMVKPSLDFFALTFALFKVGAVPVLIDPGMGVKNLGQCLEEAAPEAFIGIPRAHVARCLFGWGRSTIRRLVTVGRRGPWGGRTLRDIESAGRSPDPFLLAATRRDETAAILFTSGSTGPPKGAVYSHGVFQQQVEMLRDIYGIEPGEIDLPTFPLFALFDPALGMTAIVPDMDFTRPALADPVKIFEAIDDFGVTSMFGSPALIDRLGRHGVSAGRTLPTLRRVISAGAPVAPSVLERMSRLLPDGVEVFTPYGATEALPVCSIGSGEILAETAAATAAGCGVCVGKPVQGIDLAIITIRDEPIERWSESLRLPPGQIGEITVRGPVVTREYHRREEATRLAKIRGDGGTIWHRMGDVGYLDERGRVWFCGRKSQRVETAGEIHYTILCEGIFNAHPQVHRTALVGAAATGNGPRPVLCVELEEGARPRERERIRNELLELGSRHPHTRDLETILFHPAFPVDIRHNAKIFREKLAQWAASRLS